MEILTRYKEKNVMSVVKHQNRLPRETVGFASLEIFKS